MCATDADTIAAWCMIDYAIDAAAKTGVGTDAAYRKRGLASALTTELCRRLFDRGVTEIGWHCWDSNAASKATALRAGFSPAAEFDVLHAWYNPIDNLFAQGNAHYFERSDWAAARAAYERAFAHIAEHPGDEQDATFLDDLPRYRWFAGCAAARGDDVTAAMDHLAHAVDLGFRDVNALQKSDALVALRTHVAWTALLAAAQRASTGGDGP